MNGNAINNYYGNLYLLNCTFEDNYTTANDTRYGGAIGINTNDSQNVIRIINCTFTNNYYNSDARCRSDLGVYKASSNLENYTIAGCGDMTITGNSDGLTKESTGHAILDYSDLDNIVFILYTVAAEGLWLDGESGMELARKLVGVNPLMNIIFLTGHPEYMEEAWHQHASGYVLKPLTPKKLRHELSNLRNPVYNLEDLY